MPKIVLLWTDVVLYVMFAVLIWYGLRVRANANLRANWWKVLRDPAAFSAGIVLALFALVTAADSLHFRRALRTAGSGKGRAVRLRSSFPVWTHNHFPWWRNQRQASSRAQF